MLRKKDTDSIRSYFEDSSNLKGGYADEAVFPEDIDELSRFLEEANSKKNPVTISGGGTGTVGSRIPFGGTVISMEKFTGIIEISKERMSAIAQSGVLAEDFKNSCEKNDLFYACHPTERTAFIGGTISTNASGPRSFKYGPTRKCVKWLKMVLADGTVFDVRRGQRFLEKRDSSFELRPGRMIKIPFPAYRMPEVKNSAGYFIKDGMDLIDLFIGQEGTLSVIVEAEFTLFKKPVSIFGCFVFFANEMDSWNFAKEMREISKRRIRDDGDFPDILSLEYFDSNAVRLLRAANRNIPENINAAIFFEAERWTRGNLFIEKLQTFISRHNASLDDTWVATTEAVLEGFTKLRHHIPETINDIVRSAGFQKLSTDIAVPDAKFFDMMNFYRKTLDGAGIDHVIFGHIGECHLHANLLPKSENELARLKEMCLALVKKGVALGGTVSAEHGIGKTRHRYLEEMYGKQGISEMARVKKALDPNCILGRDNIFPKEILNTV